MSNTIRLNDYEANIDVEISVDKNVVLKKMNDTDILNEVRERNLLSRVNPITFFTAEKDLLKRHLCDILNIGYHAKNNDEILKAVRIKL